MPELGGGRLRVGGLFEAWRRSRAYIAVALLAVLVVYWWLTMISLGPPTDWGFDFRQFWQGANDVVNGVSPYPTAEMLDGAREKFDPEHIQEDFRFPYPAGAAVALAPLGALSFEVAAAIWGLVLIGSILGALWIVGIRDWRVFAVVITSHPVITSVRLGTFTPVLLLLAAVVWRWRDRPWIAGGALAGALSLKLFLWPLAVWLLATRRFAAAAIAAGLAAVMTLGAWVAIGFEGMTLYPELLRKLREVVETTGLSLVALGDQTGMPIGLARGLPLLVGVPLLVAVVMVARRDDGDRRAFSLAIIAAIAITPIVWLHYFTLLVLPLALTRPRLAWLWMIMWAFWLIPQQGNQGDLWRIVLSAAFVVAVAVCCTQNSPRRRLA